ncbi:MAG: amidohydrolase family protein [Microscillaceae bacterium]|nr:amidohydrolase family protein [Microscillaceae bacterium]
MYHIHNYLKNLRFAVFGLIGWLMIASQPVQAYNLKNVKVVCFQQDSTKTDSTQKKKDTKKPLPLDAERTVKFNTQEGTWTSLDIHPNGQEIVFDMMGDIYTMPINGGKAKAVTKGMAYDTHPRYSPDGKKIVYTSDKSGSENIWVLDMEKQDTIQLTKDKNQNYPSACWTPDGKYIVAARGRLAIKLWMYYWEGGGGIQLTEKPDQLKTIDPAVSHDGRYVYYSQRFGPWNYNAQLPQYQIGVYDRNDGKTRTLTSRYGSAFTPVLSKDGQWLVYGTRYEDKTGLILRNLKTGDEKWLAYPIQRDEQESIAPLGVLPGMAFSPDSKFLYACYGGKIHRIPVAGGDAVEIPMDVDVEIELGPQLKFNYPIKDDKEILATQIRDAVPSPDGKKLAFTVLNRLYVMDFPNGTPRRLTSDNFTEAQPAWSPDGNNLVYTTWTPEGGHLYKINVTAKGKPIRLTTKPGIYTNPAWSYKQNRIAFTRGDAQSYKSSVGPFAFGAYEEICWISADGGEVQLVDKSYGRSDPHFTKNEDRIYLTSSKGLISVRWDGTDEKEHVQVTGITTFGFANFEDEHASHTNYCMLPDNFEAMEAQQPSSASIIKMAPEGTYAMAQINNEIYVVDIPLAGKAPKISVADPSSAAFPARQLTELGGEFPTWSGDGSKVHWSLGSSHFVFDLDKAKAFDDSVKVAKKEEAKKKEEEKKKAELEKKEKEEKKEEGKEDEKKEEEEKKEGEAKKEGEKKEDKDKKKEEAKFEAKEYEIKVPFAKDMPQGRALLKGARIITMKDKEIIEQGDVLIENNRIKAVGPTGTLTIPPQTQTIDMTGKTIVPGFVDTHAHMWPAWGIHKNQVWIYAANLAYGVTTTRDPQTATTDVLTYADMVEAGLMYGPRVYSTGPGVGFWAYNLKSYEHAEKVLKQYSKYYNTKTIKMYMTGNRQQRQWIIMAAKEQQLMPTTEGGLDFKLNMTQLLDGYPGHEHALPIHPIYKDVTQTIAEAKMCVTPTLLVAYGGPWAENYFYATELPYKDQKLAHFMPYEELAGNSRRRSYWSMEEEHVFPKHAQFIKNLVEAGGFSGVGSHGQLQGLGYHWELWAMQSGGMNNHDALRVATILGATSIGLDQDLGSVEVGKLADLVILDKNPLDNIRHTNSIQYVMKNGRLYEGATLNEVYPTQRKAVDLGFKDDKPMNVPGLKK